MALEEGQQFATDEFEVTFRDGCYNLALALTTGVDDFTYLVESGATQITKTPAWSDSSSTTCSTSITWYGKYTHDHETDWQLLSATSPIHFGNFGITNGGTSNADFYVTNTDHTDFPAANGPVSFDIKAIFQSTDAN